MTPRKITDEGVASLPVHAGRVELLEEIMSTPALDRVTDTDALGDHHGGPRHPRRWVAAMAVAAAVAAIATVPLWLGDDDKPSGGDDSAATGPDLPAPQDRAVLAADGWTVEYSSDDSEHGGETSYQKGSKTLDVHWRPAATYDGYVEDREHISHPETTPGTVVDVLGRPSLIWHYSSDEHTVIRPVEKDFFLEVRGGGMKEQEFVALLGRLVPVDAAGYEASLPAEFVTTGERAAVIQEIAAEIPVPAGFQLDVDSQEVSRYQLGAGVVGDIACAWVTQFAQAKAAGNEARMTAAADAMGTSRTWPILVEMEEQGGYSQVIWEYADELAAGRVPEGYRGGLGCDD